MSQPVDIRTTLFNNLLANLNEITTQLADVYQTEIGTLLLENEKLRRQCAEVVDGTNIAVIHSSHSPPLQRPSASDLGESDVENVCNKGQARISTTLLFEDDGLIPEEDDESVTEQNEEDKASAEDRVNESVGKTLSTRYRMPVQAIQRFQMRSLWVEDPEFSDIKLGELTRSSSIMDREKSRSHEYIQTILKSQSTMVGLSRFVIHPRSKWRVFWVGLCVLFCMYDLLVQPLNVCFKVQPTSFSKLADWVSVIFWTVDMIMMFFTGVSSSTRHYVELRPGRIVQKYLKSWFLLDLVILAPEWILALLEDSEVFDFLNLLQFLRVLRLIRWMRFAKVRKFIRKMSFRFNLSKTYLQLSKGWLGASVKLVVLIHLLSCLWYKIGTSVENGWVEANSFIDVSNPYAYMVSLHWSFSRLHGLMSNYVIRSTFELFVDALLIYLSLILSSCYTGTVVGVWMERAHSHSKHLLELKEVVCRRHNISLPLEIKLSKFIASLTCAGVREAAVEEKKLLEALPETLQHDVLFESRVKALLVMGFLCEVSKSHPRIVRQISIQAVTFCAFVAGELVFAHGDACYGMIFITSGTLHYLSDKKHAQETADAAEIASTPQLSVAPDGQLSNPDRTGIIGVQLQSDSLLSEPVLWTHWTHVWRLLTAVETTALTLSSTLFAEVMMEHKGAFTHAVRYARCFVRRLNESLEDHVHVDDRVHFKDLSIENIDLNLFEGSNVDHFIFLSHYKVEAGTEATLIRDLMLDIVRQNPNHSANDLVSPIFIDSEDLTDLNELRLHVEMTASFVLLLTPGVLSRPWCLVEILTAVNSNLNIVPVEIQRPGSSYCYPDEQFYLDLLSGKFLNQASVDLLESQGMTLADVEQALRNVFQKIALPFSPHKTKTVREAELNDILKRCDASKTASKSAGRDSTSTSSLRSVVFTTEEARTDRPEDSGPARMTSQAL